MCDILAEVLTAFYPCPENWSEVDFKERRLIVLAEEVSRQESTGWRQTYCSRLSSRPPVREGKVDWKDGVTEVWREKVCR